MEIPSLCFVSLDQLARLAGDKIGEHEMEFSEVESFVERLISEAQIATHGATQSTKGYTY